MESIRIFLLLLVNLNCFLLRNIYFLISNSWIGPFTDQMVSYQIAHSVLNEVVSCTIVIYFHATMVNNKKQQFWLFLLVICVVNYLFIYLAFLRGPLIPFSS